MSEYIESNVLNKKEIKQKTGYGNHSNISIKEQAISNIARAGQNIQNDQESSVAACSHFAVVRQKIALTNDNKHIQSFKTTYDKLFAEF